MYIYIYIYIYMLGPTLQDSEVRISCVKPTKVSSSQTCSSVRFSCHNGVGKHHKSAVQTCYHRRRLESREKEHARATS